MLNFGKASLCEFRQLQVIEEEIDELLTAEKKAERVLAIGCVPRFPAGLAGTRKHIAFHELFVPGKNLISYATRSPTEARFIHSIQWNADLTALQNILDITVLEESLTARCTSVFARRRNRCRFSGSFRAGSNAGRQCA